MHNIIVTKNPDDFGKEISLSELEKVTVEIPTHLLMNTSLGNFNRVFGHIVAENENNYIVLTIYGYIGPIDKKSVKFVNYHAEWETIQ